MHQVHSERFPFPPLTSKDLRTVLPSPKIKGDIWPPLTAPTGDLSCVCVGVFAPRKGTAVVLAAGVEGFKNCAALKVRDRLWRPSIPYFTL